MGARRRNSRASSASNLVHLARDGNTTQGVLADLAAAPAAADVVTLTAGGNDLLGGDLPRAILRRLHQIAERIQPLGARVIVNTIYDPRADGSGELSLATRSRLPYRSRGRTAPYRRPVIPSRGGLPVVRSVVIPALLLAGLVAPTASAAPVQPEVAAVAHPGATALAVKQRAVVSGSFLRLRSGQLRVSVRSSARRVRLTWRTAANRTRSTTVRIRRGAGTAILATGSSRVVARALATPRLRASVRVRLRPNPWLSDVDGNGTLDYRYDGDSDGRYEMVLFDDDRNGRFEAIFLDTGTTSGLFKDANEDGYFETVALDADRDGRAERLFYDGDGDGYPEWQCLDLVGPDGVADTWVHTRVPSGNLRQDRAASDLMVRNIVTLNQLRQLDPWSTRYIPYNPAPSLLR